MINSSIQVRHSSFRQSLKNRGNAGREQWGGWIRQQKGKGLRPKAEEK